MTKLNPKDIKFDVKNTKSEYDSKTPVVAVFITTKDDNDDRADSLGRHNVKDLPKSLGNSVVSCLFEVKNGSLDEIKTEMLAAGFTYKKIRHW